MEGARSGLCVPAVRVWFSCYLLTLICPLSARVFPVVVLSSCGCTVSSVLCHSHCRGGYRGAAGGTCGLGVSRLTGRGGGCVSTAAHGNSWRRMPRTWVGGGRVGTDARCMWSGTRGLSTLVLLLPNRLSTSHRARRAQRPARWCAGVVLPIICIFSVSRKKYASFFFANAPSSMAWESVCRGPENRLCVDPPVSLRSQWLAAACLQPQVFPSSGGAVVDLSSQFIAT